MTEEAIVADSQVEQPQQELSIEDKIMQHLDGEQTEEPQEQTEEKQEEESKVEPEQESELVEVKIGKNTYLLPKEDAEEYKNGTYFNEDYTRKTQKLAIEQRTVEEQRQTLEAERQAFQNQVQANQQYFELNSKLQAVDLQLAQYKSIDWQQLYETDPTRASLLDRQERDLRDTRNQLVQEGITLREQLTAQQQAQMMQHSQEVSQAILQEIPNWYEQKAELDQYVAKYSKYGISQKEIDAMGAGLYGAAPLLWLHKAMAYDKLQESKPEMLNRVALAPKTLQKVNPQPKQNTNDVLKKIVKTSTDKSTKNNAIQKLLEQRFR